MSYHIVSSLVIKGGKVITRGSDNNVYPKRVGKPFQWNMRDDEVPELVLMDAWKSGNIHINPSANNYLWFYVFSKIGSKIPYPMVEGESYIELVEEFRALVKEAKQLNKGLFRIKLNDYYFLSSGFTGKSGALFPTSHFSRSCVDKGLKVHYLLSRVKNGWSSSFSEPSMLAC